MTKDEIEQLLEIVRYYENNATFTGEEGTKLMRIEQQLLNVQRGDTIWDSWDIADVQSLSLDDDGEPDGTISDQVARDVLETIMYNHDASTGINWDTLRESLNMVLEDKANG